MAPFRLGRAPLRRGVGAALVVFLLLGAVLYYRAQTSAPTAAPSPGTRSPADASSVPDAEPIPSTATPEASGHSDTPSAEVPAIEVYGDHATKAQPFETVRIRGTYHGGADTHVVVEVRDGAKWRAFPLSPRTDHLGRFITYVELAQPGPHWLRVLDPKAKVTSKPFVLVIEG
jgi:hypothetical protein